MNTRFTFWLNVLVVGVVALTACAQIADSPVNVDPSDTPGESQDPDLEVISTPQPDEPVGSEEKTPPEGRYAPQPGDKELKRGEVFIDGSEVLLLESFPVQVQLRVVGNLPTPCNELRAVVSEPDDQSRIEVEIYSVRDPDMICTQVLEPFEANISIGDFTEGEYTIWVNGEQAGKFSLP
ncbi:MAG: hypothetical protein PVG32_21455 [Anaerolineales bacterium]|jgi:hypothetical protein